MFLEIPEILTRPEVKRLQEMAGTMKFVDGRVTNPGNTTKNNLQADMQAAEYAESVRILGGALQRSREFADFALPKGYAPPLMCRYEPNMNYGAHADSAFVDLPNIRLRTDISCTIFLSDPSTYEGGELRIHFGVKSVDIKLPAGHCIVYPSTTLHEVRPVTSGQRLVAITFIQSFVPNQMVREMIYELNEVSALEGLNMKMENRMRLEAVKSNLLRMWSV